METGIVAAIEGLEKENANLEPELLTADGARELMALYVRVEKLASFGIAALSRKIHDPNEIARVTGTSVGKAKSIVATGEALASCDELSFALGSGAISLDQAVEIASAEESAPGSAKELVTVAQNEAFHVLKDRSRKTKLEAEQHRGLAQRQRRAREARNYSDELGMMNIHLKLEPHVGTPIVARAEAEAQRRSRAARSVGDKETSFAQHLADAYAAMLSGSGTKGRAKRPELVILVSHEVAKRGWSDVREGEVCKIPGVGPVAPEAARELASDAFLNGVLYDGKDLRQFKRWSRDIPVEVQVALELGHGPDFDGVACADCGNRFRTEFDHVQPRAAKGPTSRPNLDPRCYTCHKAKTERDRRSGAFTRAGP